jgi:hypothetical protein
MNTNKNMQSTETQWDKIPADVIEVYTQSTEKLYSQKMPVETVAQKEAAIYNSLFSPYGLSKPISN